MSIPKPIDRDITAVVDQWASAIGTPDHQRRANLLDDLLVDLTACRKLRDRLLHAACEEVEQSFMEGRGDEALRRLAPLYPEFSQDLHEFYGLVDTFYTRHDGGVSEGAEHG